MATLDKRIAVLEQARVDPGNVNRVVVFAIDGESTAEALARAGYTPGESDVICVRFVEADHAKP